MNTRQSCKSNKGILCGKAIKADMDVCRGTVGGGLHVPIWMLISLAWCLQPPPILRWSFLSISVSGAADTGHPPHFFKHFFPTFSHPALLPLLENSALIPAAYHSGPRHTKPGKAHPRRIGGGGGVWGVGGGGGDEIKYTRRLIWITGARSMRTGGEKRF